jgi:hypothetical protein
MKSHIIIFIVLSMIFIAGCVGTSPEEIAKGTNMARDFLNIHNATLNATHLDRNQMESILPSLNEMCGSRMSLGEYDKVSIADSTKNAEIVIWINASDVPVCAIRTEEGTLVVQSNPRNEKSPYESGMPDLIVSNVDISPKSPSLDDVLSITITIKNVGEATADPVEYIVGSYGANGKILRSNVNDIRVSLEPLGTATYNVAINAAEIPSGQLLRIGVNPSYAGHYAVEESNYENNIKDTAITIV